ncbi:Carboxy-terminal domain (CTD) phosphatase [Dissophora ornata]|nr:Carboxy-terminal domain (CTD) phosphatase [Dissophora ornata]
MADNDIKYYIPAGCLPATIITVKASKSSPQSEGDELIEYEYMEQVQGFVHDGETSTHARRAEIRATKDGYVRKIYIQKGDVIDDEDKVVMEYEGCDHDTQFEGLCVLCGKTVPKNSKSHVNMTHDATSLSVSRTEAKRLEHVTVERLLSEGKLSLIVDLDQTLIHATVGTAIDEWVNAQGEMPETFLKNVTSLYELHIYTMGTRNYAAAVANVIDPDGRFFSQRILSRDENSSMTQKSIERLFPCDTSMVVVIDDRADVWQYSPNLVKVHPYEYFVGAGDINAGHLPKQDATVKSGATPIPKSTEPSATPAETSTPKTDEPAAVDSQSTTEPPSTAEASPTTEQSSTIEATTAASETPPSTTPAKSEDVNKATKPKAPVMEDTDDELRHILEILETIHERFYDAREKFIQKESTKPADVEAIIREMKKNVLRGVNVLFSSLIPLGQAPERTDIWRQAQSFGAECSHELNSRVTHVVAAKPGTAKVMKARQRRNIKIVRPEWLYHSIGKWQRQDESQYLLLDPPNKSTLVSTTPPLLTEGEEDTGVDEDDQGGISEGMDENHRPLSIGNDEIDEHLKLVNWDDMGKEVEEFVGDMDDTDFDSDTSTHSNAQSDASTDGNRSPLVSLKRTRIPRRSGLGASVMYGSSDDEDDDDSAAGGLDMEGLENSNKVVSSDDSDGDIDDESGSDEDDESVGVSEGGSDADQPSRRMKRRRIIVGNSEEATDLALGDGEDMDADDEVTMDHSSLLVGSRAEDEEEEDDDDFLNDLENDIDAQLNEDDDEEE